MRARPAVLAPPTSRWIASRASRVTEAGALTRRRTRLPTSVLVGVRSRVVAGVIATAGLGVAVATVLSPVIHPRGRGWLILRLLRRVNILHLQEDPSAATSRPSAFVATRSVNLTLFRREVDSDRGCDVASGRDGGSSVGGT